MRLLVVLLVALALFACDGSKKKYGEALKKYEALISANKPLSDPAYDSVLTELDAVTGDASADAKKLAGAIRRLRTPMNLPPRPLARVTGEGDDALSKKAAECAELAKAVGMSSDAGRQAAIDKLAECRRAVEKLDVARIHAQDPLGQAHVGHEDPVDSADGGGS